MFFQFSLLNFLPFLSLLQETWALERSSWAPLPVQPSYVLYQIYVHTCTHCIYAHTLVHTHYVYVYTHTHTHIFSPQTVFQLSPSVVVSPCMFCMIILSLVINLDNSSFFRCLFEESHKRVEESVHSTDSSSLQPAPAALLFIQLRCPCCILTIIMTLGMHFRRKPAFPDWEGTRRMSTEDPAALPFIQLKCPCCTLTHSFS